MCVSPPHVANVPLGVSVVNTAARNSIIHQLAFTQDSWAACGKEEFAFMLALRHLYPCRRQAMERELWLTLYRLSRELGGSPWFAVTKFFRLGDRGRLLVGGAPRSTDSLGL